ncbi:MAG: penicillin acylase family protein [Acidobacteriota bacterium]|nr:penicillin acylase family protein [Acidobacteriota bacterium]
MEIIFNFARWPLIMTVVLTLISNGNNLPQLRASHSPATGTIQVAGVRGRINIRRDRHGVPHIRATTEQDAHFGLGYVHAQDRLWQMEFQRRLGNGRLAEILGESGLITDRLFRTLGLHRTASAAWAKLSWEERQPIETYVAGINAYLNSRRHRRLPPEFQILDVEPEPWRPEDVMVWSKVIAWSISSNWDKELLRAQIIQKLGPDKTAQLMPAYTADGPTILPNDEARSQRTKKTRRQEETSADLQSAIRNPQSAICNGLLELNRTIEERTGLGADGFGTNSWVLSGARTTTGKPILADDPHLTSQTPAIWYLARTSGGDMDVIGATIPGLPGVQVGHNGWIAWGISTINVDSQDVYMERINERNEAEYKGAWEPLQIVPETIKVKDKPDLNLKVRISRHGSLVSDVINPTGQALALRWTGSDPEDTGTLAALAFNRARNWHEFTSAFRAHRSADQNYVYADRQGNIGYIAAGTIPVRAKGDGRLPVPGWTDEHEWTGYVPFDELPQIYNPPQGYIVTANNKVAGDGDYPHLIGTNFAAPYRAARIVEMIESKAKHSPDDMRAMQADVSALHARELLPLMLKTQPSNERSKQAVELLRGWDARVKGESAQAAIFEAWYLKLGERLFADELGDALWRTYSDNIYMVGMALPVALEENTAWCDDVRTPGVETCADTLAASLAEGLAKMAESQGTPDVNAWRWDNVHHALFPHNPFEQDAQLKPLFSRSIPNGGDKFTVNVASVFRWAEYHQLHSAQYRQIIDFGDITNSRFIIAPGQSGNPYSRHYDDLLKRWQRVEYLPMRYGGQTTDDAAHEQLVLEPQF